MVDGYLLPPSPDPPDILFWITQTNESSTQPPFVLQVLFASGGPAGPDPETLDVITSLENWGITPFYLESTASSSVPYTVARGSFSLVPEPAALVWLALGALAARRRWDF